jgi:hypothetical protein
MNPLSSLSQSAVRAYLGSRGIGRVDRTEQMQRQQAPFAAGPAADFTGILNRENELPGTADTTGTASSCVEETTLAESSLGGYPVSKDDNGIEIGTPGPPAVDVATLA